MLNRNLPYNDLQLLPCTVDEQATTPLKHDMSTNITMTDHNKRVKT